MSEPQITVLESGLTVVTQHVEARQAALNLAVKAGARHETNKEKGASHFLEHMLLAETEQNDIKQNATKTQAMFGSANGATDYETIEFDRQCRPAYVGDAIELLANAMLSPVMDGERIEKERTSILREWDMDGNDELSGYDAVQRIAFPASGLEKAIDGSKGRIKAMTAETLQSFKEKHFTAPNMVLTVVGDVDHEAVCKMAEAQFAELPTREAETKKFERPARYSGGIFYSDEEYSPATSINIAFEASGLNDDVANAKDTLLCEILTGASDNARLLNSLRHELGAVYNVTADLNTFKDNGLMVISTQCDAEAGNSMIEHLCEELATLPQTLTADELELHKKSLIGALERSETFQPDKICEELTTDIALTGKPGNLDAEITTVEALTLEDMQQHAQKVFSTAPCVYICADCEENQLPDYTDITTMLGNPRYVDESGRAIEDVMPSTDRSVAEAQISAQPAKAAGRNVGAQR